MRRFVREYACAVMAMGNPLVKVGKVEHPAKQAILRVLLNCERGRLSDLEAVRAIAQVDAECEGEPWRISMRWAENHNGQEMPMVIQ